MDWQIKKLGDIFQIERGGSPRPIERFLTTDKDGINWIKIGDTKKVTKYIYKTEEKIKPSGLKKTRLVHDGDFILSNSMSFGRPYIMRTTGAIHDGWLVLREKLPGINKDFFYYLLGSPVVFEQFDSLAAGSTVRNLNTKLVSNVEVSFPSLTEQKRVVNTLDEIFEKVAAARESAEKNLKNSQELFESYLQSVFANPGKSWGEKRLGEVCDIQNGYAFSSKDYANNGLRVIRIGNVQNGNIVDKRPKFVPDAFAKRVSDFVLQESDILISLTGDVGRVGRISKELLPAVLNQRVGRFFNFTNEVDIGYLFTILNSKKFEQQVISASEGAAQKNTSTRKIKDIKINFPKSSMEQKAIVKKIDALSLETKKLEKIYEQKLADLEELKKSVLQRAFTGKL